MMLWDRIRQRLMKYPNQIICEGDVSIKYSELCEIVQEYSKKLSSKYYAVLCDSELNAAMAILSCIAAQRTVVPLPARYGVEVYQKIIDRINPPCVITDIGGNLSEYSVDANSNSGALIDTAVVLFTSGSTGTPKGVMLSEENLISNVESISRYFPINEKDVMLISRPLYHSSVLTGEFLVSLFNGAKIVFSSEPFNPSNILGLIKEHNVSVFGSTPTLTAILSRFVKNNSKTSVKKLSISGECMTDGMAKLIRNAFPCADIYCGYGLSEASPRVAYLPPELFDTCPTSAGIPIQSVKVRVLCKNGKDALIDEVGELLVKGPNVMNGYYDDPKRTNNTLKDGWLHTGDLATFGENGLLYIKGRKDDMMICAGMNIYPAEIENALSSDERVKDAIVRGYVEDGKQKIELTVIGDFSSLKEVIDLCKKKLPKYQMPSKIIIADKTVTNLGGKKRRKQI